MPVWSCAWNSDDKNYFYAGQQNGIVCVFDTRNTDSHVQQLNTEGSRSPVVSLQYVSRNPNASFRFVFFHLPKQAICKSSFCSLS